ncbi:beta strand repeat-containing protein [Alicyclobacillus sendaiensis]|uniref:beta strand repeat-containing protein n=1 Tax=Alicyclobacillus sendaiensis TaxID=192387 RepID=UPI001C3F33D5|nr:hypothetical protein [Alicyclobacillus sendaiensis]
MAFAATSSTGLTPVGQVAFTFNGQTVSNPYIMDGKDSGNTTAFAPIYYFDQLLAKLGIQATWNGATHTWALTDSNVNVQQVAANIAGGLGSGNTTITLNGTAIKKINTQVAKDPAGGPVTTYFPVYYVQQVFGAMGVNASWNGSTGLAVVTQNTPSLSAVTVTGANVGNGSATSPAVSNGSAVTVSTTLTDAFGNPISGVNTTLTLTGTVAPTVTVNGVTAAATTVSGGWSYQVPTNAAGVASAQISVPSGVAASYTVQFSAPYSNNGVQVTSSNAYVEFVPANSAAISPVSSQSNPYHAVVSSPSNETAGLVPVTVTLPQAAAGVAVQFTLSGGQAFFANAQGGVVENQSGGTATTTVYTNSNGQATVYVNDNNTDSGVMVTASVSGYGSISPVYISWGQAGVATQTANVTASNVLSGSGTNSSPYVANAGTNVVISGQVQDANGNPVANAQLLVVNTGTSGSTPGSYTDTNSGAGSYVSGSNTTSFPSVNAGGLQPGMTNPSLYGEVITTDSNGNFSFTVTDSNIEVDHYYLYGITAGAVGQKLGNWYVSWQAGSTLTNIGVASSASNLDSNYNGSSVPTSVSGITAPEGGVAQVAFAGYSGVQEMTGNLNLAYTLSLNHGDITKIYATTASGQIAYTVNGTNGYPSVQVNVTGSGGLYTITVNGVTVTTQATSPIVGVGVSDTTAETDTLTITSGNAKATAQLQFLATNPAKLANGSPTSGLIQAGQTATVSFQVEDSNGNPVPNTAVPITFDSAASNMWITEINGVTLQQTETTGATSATEPTPIPLYQAPADIDYSSVNIPGVVTASLAPNTLPTVTVRTDSNGNVTLTVQDGDVTYYNGVSADAYVDTSPNGQSGDALYVGYANTWDGIDISGSNNIANVVASVQNVSTSPSNIAFNVLSATDFSYTVSGGTQYAAAKISFTSTDTNLTAIASNASDFVVKDANNTTYTYVSAAPTSAANDFTLTNNGGGNYTLTVYSSSANSLDGLKFTVNVTDTNNNNATGSFTAVPSSNLQVNVGAVVPSQNGSSYDYSFPVTVADAAGNPVVGLTYSNFAVKDTTSGTSYTGASTLANGDFTVSYSGGTYTVEVQSSTSIALTDQVQITVTNGSGGTGSGNGTF